MLSFAEAYDPLWEARVYKEGKLVEKVRSIPLYSVINGFWIKRLRRFVRCRNDYRENKRTQRNEKKLGSD